MPRRCYSDSREAIKSLPPFCTPPTSHYAHHFKQIVTSEARRFKPAPEVYCRGVRCGLGPMLDRMLAIMRLVLACGLYYRHIEVCVTDVEIHLDSVKHSQLGLLSSCGRDEAPRRAFATSPAYNPYNPTPDARLGPAHSFLPSTPAFHKYLDTCG